MDLAIKFLHVKFIFELTDQALPLVFFETTSSSASLDCFQLDFNASQLFFDLYFLIFKLATYLLLDRCSNFLGHHVLSHGQGFQLLCLQARRIGLLEVCDLGQGIQTNIGCASGVGLKRSSLLNIILN